MPDYLTVLEVLTIHSSLVDAFGGANGVRDMGALEAAVFRPQTGYYRDPIAEAAALMESLIQNRSFLDTNLRTAVAAADIHLRMHGWELAGDSTAHHEFIIGQMESGELERSSIEDWLRVNVESTAFGISPTATVPPRDEWDRGTDDMSQRRRRQMGQELSSPLTEEETRWLEEDLES